MPCSRTDPKLLEVQRLTSGSEKSNGTRQMNSRNKDKFALKWLSFLWALCIAGSWPLLASASSEGEEAVERTYVTAPPAPLSQTDAEMTQKSAGCMTCH